MSGLIDTSFQNIVGQDHACEVLISALRSQRVPHAYLFVGPEGVGRKKAALQWAKILNCLNPVSPVEACESCSSCRKIQGGIHPDVHLVDFQYQARLLKEDLEKQQVLKIDTVREIERFLRLKPLEGKVKVTLLDPAEKLVEVAAHALLKILEEPPPQTHLVLLAADPRQLLSTIRSRCHWVTFRPLPLPLLAEKLVTLNDGLSLEQAREVARLSAGSLTRAQAQLEEGEEVEFDWQGVPLSEVLAWCEQFRSYRNGRVLADRFLRRLLSQTQQELYGDVSREEAVRWVLDSLEALKHNVSPQLILEVLILKLRRQKKQLKVAN